MASNRNVLKKYAPQARLDFIQAVTNRAALFGITKDGNVTGEIQGDLFILSGKAFPRSVATQRARLISRIARDGFAHVMEAVAYTWFNRFLAIRYMEVHEYFDHGCRVLSNPKGHSEPEILEKATSVDLPGLSRDEIVTLKLDGTKDEQIYRKLLMAQCNDLHRAMPFLFEKIDDETELLLPENLLQSDSIVRKLVNEIAEGEWQEIEIIGWLYQFYISDKKDQVIGKVVKSEDIPAATQLFTPNWIVKYMVQNSLGAQWLATYPDSGIRANYPMEYYIAPANQTPEVQAQIDAITPDQLDPEAITLIDPAVGSGHILVEAYDLFRAIYLERGYTNREAARAILTKNLFGLDIDDRAAQMAGFALLMKACADDRTVLRNPPKLNVLALQDSDGLDADALAKALLPQERFEIVPSGDLLPETLSQPTLSIQQPTSKEAKAVKALVALFDGAKTFGSLITVPDSVMQSLPLIDALLAKPLTGDLLLRQAQDHAQEVLKPLVEQARLLSEHYNCVVANPPYMNSKGMNNTVKEFVKIQYEQSKTDLFSCFQIRGGKLAKLHGIISMVTMESWMFISSHEDLRTYLNRHFTIKSLVHMPYLGKGGTSMGINFGTVTYTLQKLELKEYVGDYSCIRYYETNDIGVPFEFPTPNERRAKISQREMESVPGIPIAYWISDAFRGAFSHGLLRDVGTCRNGMTTGNNDLFLRFWHEVDFSKFSNDIMQENCSAKWVPYSKGGEFRRWYGNNDLVVDWEKNGRALKNNKPKTIIRSESYYFQEAVTWSLTSSTNFGARFRPAGAVFDVNGMSGFFPDPYPVLALLNSRLAFEFLRVINPTMAFQSGDVERVAYGKLLDEKKLSNSAKDLVLLTKNDWDASENSWDFSENSLCNSSGSHISLAQSYNNYAEIWKFISVRAQSLEPDPKLS